MMEDRLKAYAELEERMRQEPNNWTLFFEAAELWSEYIESTFDGLEGERLYLTHRMIDQRLKGYRPGFWERLRIKLVKRG